MTRLAPIPVSVIGGFLGAGKTTLLNRLLEEADGRRLGLIVNDFGDINIDEKLIVARDEDMISLANGCICCSIGSDFLRALVAMTSRVDPPEQIIIEASGVANPSRISAIAQADPDLSLQGVIVLIDAVNFVTQFDDPLLTDTLEGQVRAGDLIVITKSDIVLPDEIVQVEKTIAAIGATPRIISSAVGDLPIQLLFEIAGSGEGSKEISGHTHHPFWTGSFVSEQPCNLDRLREAVVALPASLLRLKGMVRDAEDCGHIVQWVAGRLRVTADPSPRVGKNSTQCELVYIGVGAGNEELEVRQLLASALQAPR